MEEIVYEYGGGLYVNLTNRCPCRCNFCIRSQTDGLGSADSLWLEHEPAAEEVLSAFEKYNLSHYQEVIFCGYGEPLCALDTLLEVSRHLKKSGIRLRINTNGLGDLIHGKPTVPLLKGLIDAVSISLNAPDAQCYDALCHPAFENAYEAMLAYARACRDNFDTHFSVVDVIQPAEIARCKMIAEELGIPLRVRHFSA